MNLWLKVKQTNKIKKKNLPATLKMVNVFSKDKNLSRVAPQAAGGQCGSLLGEEKTASVLRRATDQLSSAPQV